MAITNSDGSIVLSTKIDVSPVSKALDLMKQKFASLKQQKTTIQVLTNAIKDQQIAIKNLEKEYATLVAQGEGNSENAKELQQQIKDLRAELNQLTNAAQAMGAKTVQASTKASRGLKQFGKRIAGIVKSALIFSVLYRVMQGVVKLFKNILMSDEKFKQDWEELKAALYTVAYPIMRIIVPAVKFIVQQVRNWAVSIGKIAAFLQGMSYSELVDQAKASKEAADNYAEMEKSSKKTADNVQKQLASFDDIQILSSGNEEEQGAGFTGFAGLQEYDGAKEKTLLDDLMTAIGGALAAVGLILIVSGKIGLGIGFLTVGASIWAITEFATKELNTDKVSNVLAKITGIAGTALLALGVLLCVFGVISPISIALIVAGASLLVNGIALSSEKIVEAIQSPLGIIMSIVSGALLVIGIILVCTGVGIPIGIALILAGVAGLVTVVAVNRNTIVGWIKDVWEAVKDFWNRYIAPVFTAKWWKNLAINCGNGLIAGFEAAINGIIWAFEKMINWITDGLNKISFDLPEWMGGGHFGINIPRATLGRISIPRLAQGAVIPPNREFLAVLGDQKQGTNIEAPLQTIVDAFNIALSQNVGAGHTTKEEHYYLGETELMTILYKIVKGGERLNGASLVEGGI